MAGVWSATGEASAAVTRLLRTGNQWHIDVLPTMPQRVTGCAGAVYNGTLFIFDGIITHEAMLTWPLFLTFIHDGSG